MGIGSCAAGKFAEHSVAGVNGVDGDAGIVVQKPGCEAAIAIPKDQGGSTVGEGGQKSTTASGQEGAEREPLHPAVDVGEAVEVWGGRA